MAVWRTIMMAADRAVADQRCNLFAQRLQCPLVDPIVQYLFTDNQEYGIASEMIFEVASPAYADDANRLAVCFRHHVTVGVRNFGRLSA
jgi:hypothetical protein